MAEGLRPRRVAVDIGMAAAAVAPSEGRTVAEQISFWARIGMHIERSGSVERRRVLAVAAGEDQFRALAPQDRATAHAVVDAHIAERVNRERFGPAGRTDGHRTVSLDGDGNLTVIDPDGTRRIL